jgi:sterol 3beta-glucosyltransferase
MDLRLLAMGTLGDVRPYVALGLGLRRAGFDVTLCSTADFRTLAEDAGLPCLTAQEDLRTLLARCRTTRAARWAFFDMVLRETPALAAGADALIYSPAFLLSAPHVVERSGVPALLAALQPFLTPTRAFPVAGMPAWPLGGWYNRLTYAFVDAFLTVRLRGPIDRWRAQALGLPPYRSPGPLAAVCHSGTPMLYGFSPTVLPKPADWGAHVRVTGYWSLPSPEWQPPEALRRFLDAGPAPVYIGFGSMTGPDPEGLTRLVLTAIRQANVRAVVASGWGGLRIDDPPENVLPIESAPHDWLFARVAAAVHHGGAGTVGASLRAGLPTLVIPFRADQPFWGRRVHALGAGPPPIPAPRLSASSLARALRWLLDDQLMRRRSQAIGAAIRAEDGVASAVGVISQWLTGG